MHTIFRKLVGQPNLVESALFYARVRHWDVYPGTRRIRRGRTLACSCGHADCPTPGEHPDAQDWHRHASTHPQTIRWWWELHPDASIIVPVGRTFDVIDIPATVGQAALGRIARLGLRVGPVLAAHDRYRFLVVPGARQDLPELLGWLDWPYTDLLDLRCYGEGDHMAVPALDTGPKAPLYWVIPPTPDNMVLPYARDIVPTITYSYLGVVRGQRSETRPDQGPAPLPVQRAGSRLEGDL